MSYFAEQVDAPSDGLPEQEPIEFLSSYWGFEEHSNQTSSYQELTPRNTKSLKEEARNNEAEACHLSADVNRDTSVIFNHPDLIERNDSPSQNIAIHWLRKGLRLHDNPALWESVRLAKCCRCIYIIDPTTVKLNSTRSEIVKWRFLLESLQDLDSALRNYNSRLYVLMGQPAYVLPVLFKSWHINILSIEEDPTPSGLVRDKAIEALANQHGVYFVRKTSHTLHSTRKWRELCKDRPFRTLRQFLVAFEAAGLPEFAIDPVPLSVLHTGATVNENEYQVPSLSDLGLHTGANDAVVWHGGETEALKHLAHHLERRAWVACFDSPKLDAGTLLASPSGLGPYLNFGCLSPRLLYWKLDQLYRRIHPGVEPPLSLHGQLIVREFYYALAACYSRFDQLTKNPICLPIEWKSSNKLYLQKLSQGETGFPWIDFIMKQLITEGWCHMIGKHSIISFITYGLLFNSWQEAAKLLESYCLDGDSVNSPLISIMFSGASVSRNFKQENPVLLGKAVDPKGASIRRYIPALMRYPASFIYEPWLAPMSVQKECGCIIGTDYPAPMLDHHQTFQESVQALQTAVNSIMVKKTSKRPKSSSNINKPEIFQVPVKNKYGPS